MDHLPEFDAGYLLAAIWVLGFSAAAWWSRGKRIGAEAPQEHHDDGDEFEPRRHDPEDAARLTVF